MITETQLDRLRYPIGKFKKPETIDAPQRAEWINNIAEAPQLFRNAVANLTPSQLQTPYRPGGWTVRQVIHHVADSHMNALIRFKLALTEINPTIKPYEEALWAELADYKAPIENSLHILEALHLRWVLILQSMTEEDFKKTFYHPANKSQSTLETTLGMYVWHGGHHLAHITELAKKEGW